jgi:RNA polymerase sigma-70 factor (ECF subfamily)
MKSLIERLNTGDNIALTEIYDTHSKGLYHYALGLLFRAEDAEDALHTVFTRLVDLARRGDLLTDNLQNYLYRAVRNEAYSILERRKSNDDKARALSMTVLTSIDASPLETMRVNEALKRLPPEQREVVVLKIFEDFTFREIAELTGEKLDTVASRYKYAVKKLEEMLHAN